MCIYYRLAYDTILVQIETRLQVLEGKDLEKSAGSTKGKPKIEMYEKDRKKGAGALTTPAKVSTACHGCFVRPFACSS